MDGGREGGRDGHGWMDGWHLGHVVVEYVHSIIDISQPALTTINILSFPSRIQHLLTKSVDTPAFTCRLIALFRGEISVLITLWKVVILAYRDWFAVY